MIVCSSITGRCVRTHILIDDIIQAVAVSVRGSPLSPQFQFSRAGVSAFKGKDIITTLLLEPLVKVKKHILGYGEQPSVSMLLLVDAVHC